MSKHDEALSRAAAKLDRLVELFENAEPSEALAREMYKAVAVVAEHLKQNDDRPDDGRKHGKVKVKGTVTGRFKNKKPLAPHAEDVSPDAAFDD